MSNVSKYEWSRQEQSRYNLAQEVNEAAKRGCFTKGTEEYRALVAPCMQSIPEGLHHLWFSPTHQEHLHDCDAWEGHPYHEVIYQLEDGRLVAITEATKPGVPPSVPKTDLKYLGAGKFHSMKNLGVRQTL